LGHIVISAAVHELVCNAVEYHALDLGNLRLKNIQRPIRAYSISSITGNAHVQATQLPHLPPKSIVINFPTRRSSAYSPGAAANAAPKKRMEQMSEFGGIF
jgi:hypothetical protein